jgi:excisionase family DNA binding protein
MRIDRDVASDVLRVLQPLGVEAALRAIEERAIDSHSKRRQIELALEQSRFEAARAHRQFDAVDPGNRLVAGELERRWNERLSTVTQYEAQLQAANGEHEPEMTPELRQRLLDLAADLALAWDHPSATSETRKRILRAVLKEIVVRVTDTQLQLMVHWQGGDHTALVVVKNRTGQHRWTTDTGVEQLINDLARQMPDGGIASLLNRMGQRTAKGHTWTEARVRSFRGDHRIAVYRDGEREARGEMTLEQAAHLLQLSKMSVLRMISARELPAHQACKGAAWVIRHDDLARVAAQRTRPPDQKGPRTTNPNQKSFQFQ